MTNTRLAMSWDAYTSRYFDIVYDRYSDALGHRPSFTVLHGGDHATVSTSEPDAARAIIAEVEYLSGNVGPAHARMLAKLSGINPRTGGRYYPQSQDTGQDNVSYE